MKHKDNQNKPKQPHAPETLKLAPAHNEPTCTEVDVDYLNTREQLRTIKGRVDDETQVTHMRR